MTALVRLLVVCILVASSFALSRQSEAGVMGWCGPVLGSPGTLACSANEMAACQAQWQNFSPTSPFFGLKDGSRPGEKQCDWTYRPLHDPLEHYPQKVFLYCDDYGSVDFPDQCFTDRVPSRPPESASCGAGNVNGGGSPGGMTGHPIELLNGAKIFRIEDYKTADGSLVLERRYNSRANIGARAGVYGAIVREPAGLGRLWRLAFQHEFHLGWYFGSFGNVEFLTADGGVYAFQKNSSGGMDPVAPAVGISKQTDYRVEFVGTWPSNLADVQTSSSQWRVTDPEDRVWLFETYQDAGSGTYRIALPVSVTFRNGLQWTFSYGTYKQLTSITDSFGKTLTFDWNTRDYAAAGGTGVAPSTLASVTLPDTTKFKYLYDATVTHTTGVNYDDRLIKVEHRDASNNLLDATEYMHESTVDPYFVTGIKDSAGTRRWTVEYDSTRRAITSKGPSDADKTTVAYTAIQFPTFTRTVTNALGKETVYNYQYLFGPLYLLSIDGNASTNCPSSSQTFAYTSSDFVTRWTDEEGRAIQYTRDSRGRETARTDGYGTGSARTVSTTWHSTLNLPTQIVQPGLTTDLTWTSGRLTQVTQTDTTSHTVPYSTNGQTRTWAYTYGTYGQLLTIDGPLSGTGDTVTYTYDSNGYVATVTNEVGHVTTVNSVNGRGQPTSITDPNSVVTALTYDSEGRIKTVTVDPSGLAALTTIDYNVLGDVTKITKPNSAYLQYTYDTGRRITKIEDNTGASVELDRNNLGNITARRIKDPSSTLKLSQTATFDELGRLLTFVGASSQTWTHAYDKTDNLKSITDPRTNTYQWSFDSLSRLISETDEDTNVVTLTRNGKDQITNYSDPRSLSTSYVRNGFDDVIQRVSPDTGTTIYTVNALGKSTQITDGRSVVTNLTYDNAGRLLTKQYPAATAENITYTWDSVAGGNKGKGRLTKIEDASGSVEWTYNVLGQATQEKKTTSSVVYTVDYTYDLDGNITQMIYPSGRILSYSRNSVGRISGVTTKKDSGSSTVTLASSFDYMPFGPLQTLTYGNGLVLWKTFTSDYNPNTLIVEDSSTTILNWGYGYWYGDFDITNVWDGVTSSRDENYVYTPNHRLQNAYGSWGELTYWQDGVGNRTHDIFDNGSTTTTKELGYPNNNNLITGVTQGLTTLRTITHDGAGNITTDDRSGTVYNYRYNNRGRLDRLTVGSTVTADYTYDGLERMAIRTTQNMTPASTTHYIYDRAGRLIAEASGAGAALREYIWVDELPLAVVADIDTVTPKLWYVHADHLDRPARMTDVAKSVVWNAYYWPYGDVRSITGSASLNLRFPGQYFLVESGLHYNWHRQYDPTLGRYVQADPIKEVLGGPLARDLIQGRSDNVGDTPKFGSIGTQSADEVDALPEFHGGPSIHAYASSNPQNRTDRTGLLVSRPANFTGASNLCTPVYARGGGGGGGGGGSGHRNICPLIPGVSINGIICLYQCPGGGPPRLGRPSSSGQCANVILRWEGY